MIEIDPRDLSRGRQRKLHGGNFADLAESEVVHEYNLQLDNASESWFDAIHPDTGAKYEVKSTRSEIGDQYPSGGRFRLWENQHRSLIAADSRGVSWYAFVFLDERDGLLKIQRKKPQTITALVNSRGGWNRAGHTTRSDRQHKLPATEIF